MVKILYFLSFSYFLLHVFWTLVTGCLTIWDYYILWMNWPLYHYEIILCVPDSSSILNSTFSDISIDTPDIFWLVLYDVSWFLLLLCICVYV